MCSGQVQANVHQSPVDPCLQPGPLTMKMSLEYIAPASNESGPKLPPINMMAAKERPTLPSLSQCQLAIPRAQPVTDQKSYTLLNLPRFLLPSPKSSRNPSPISQKFRIEPYPRFRDRHSSPYRSSSSTTSSTRSSDSPSISPKPSPKPLHATALTHFQDLYPSEARNIASSAIATQHPASTTNTASSSFPSGLNVSSRLSISCNRTSERPEYDSEELLAIAFLRLAKPGAVPWKEVKIAFNLLFPPGTPRRTSAPRQAAKNLLPTYSERDVGGLECRYYRIRTQESMGAVRKHRRNSDCVTELEKEALRNMQKELVKEWLKSLDHSTKVDWGLLLTQGENAKSLLDRAVKVYEEQSPFWNMLLKIRATAVGGAFASRD